MEYERKNLCCDDGFLIIFCHDRYYKVHFYFYQIIINIRVIVCSSIHLSGARYKTTVSGYTSSRCCSGTPNEVRPHHHTAIMITKLHAKSSSLGDFTQLVKLRLTTLETSALIQPWKSNTEYLKKSFSCSGVKPWNSLQTMITAEPSLQVLRNLCAVSVSSALINFSCLPAYPYTCLPVH